MHTFAIMAHALNPGSQSSKGREVRSDRLGLLLALCDGSTLLLPCLPRPQRRTQLKTPIFTWIA